MATVKSTSVVTATPKVGDAVGVQQKNWYVAIVNNNTEKQCAKKIAGLGYEYYLPTQTETRQWRTGRRHNVTRIVFPALLFILSTERERRNEIVRQPYIKRFLTDRSQQASSFGAHPVAIIPEEQIQRLKFILDNAENPVEFDAEAFHLGDKVRIVRGKLMGIEGNIIRCDDKSTYFAIQINLLGVAKVQVKPEDLEPVR